MTAFPIKNKPPHNVSVLERRLTEASKQSGVAAGRLRRWLGFMVVAAMLDQARDPADGTSLFLVKGGVAMELRVDVGARATKDLDTAFRARMDAVTDHLDLALRVGHGDFTARRTELEAVRDTGALRCDVKLAYRSRSLITVQLEIAAAEAGMGDDVDHVLAKSLDHIGLTGPVTVPCVAVRWQIAQKLHACTEVPALGQNDRFRDLIDLQLMSALVAEHRWPDVRSSCLSVFDGRAKHAWPPDVTIYPSWTEGYRALAEETDFAVVDVDEAAHHVRQLIARIDDAG